MPKFESELQLTSVKNASTSNGGIQFSDTSNTLVMHIGDDNRVGIGTDVPESTLHVDGTITADGLIVPPGTIATATDTADFWGFNPKFNEWETENLANGYVQVGTGTAERTTDAVLGAYSARFPSGQDIIWSREVTFGEPLYANVFIQGTYNYKFASHSSGEPGFAITLTHRAIGDDSDSYSNTFIAPTLPTHNTGSWQTAGFRAVTPPNREIQKLKIEIVHSSGTAYDTDNIGTELSAAAGNSTTLGGATNDWYVDGFGFNFMHPDMRIDQEGAITGAYIAFASITDAHIKNYIASGTSRIFDNPESQLTNIPPEHHEYTDTYPPVVGQGVTITLSDGSTHTTIAQDVIDGKYRYGTGLEHDALVANSSYADGWAIEKGGDIKATGIKIYSDAGKVLIRGGSSNPFDQWAGASLSHLDPEASSYLYGLSFEESNSTGLRANLQFLATSGLSNNVVANTWSMYLANTVTGPPGDKGGLLANAIISFNGIDYDAPPGSIFTGGKSLVKNQDAYILFLANTSKWDSDVGAKQRYHANSYLGEYGLYVLGTPTVGGWLYHPHGNNTWYTIDSTQTGDRLHEGDFLVIGRISTNAHSEISRDKTYLQSPKHPDSITLSEAEGSYPPIGITAGGILFADINLNRYAHDGTANNGQLELTNQRNTPNTRFTFIHPGTDNPSDSTMHTVNGALGVVTSLEDFPGSRYITFIGTDTSRFDLQSGHSPDFVAAFRLGDTWYYNQDEGKYSVFTPTAKDCIVARVDANGSVGALTNIYRYAERELQTQEGATLSDLIIDPPRGMESGGILFAELTINKEFKKSDNTFVSNSGFVSITNSVNNPRNEFYAVHPSNGNNFYVDGVGRGVVTSLDSTTDARTYGIRHIAYVGTDQTRFSLPSAAYAEVSNNFVAVTKYDSNGNPRADGKWYYDNGATITNTFTPDANDFIVATINSYDPSTSGIDQITRYASREGQIIIGGVPTTISSFRNILNNRIDTANAAATTALADAQNAYANAVSASANAAQALGLLDGKLVIYYEIESSDDKYANNVGDDTRFDYNDIWINTSLYNKFLDDSWSSNAIFKYANTTLGFNGTLAWRHDPNHTGGRAALAGLDARDAADRATIIYMEERSAEQYPFFGPNVAVMSTTGSITTQLNKNPEGDLWYDIRSYSSGAAPTNHPYVYRTNSSFNASNTTHTGFISVEHGGANSWAQTVHNTATSGVWNRNTAQTGWWSIQDSSAGDAAAAIADEAAARAAGITSALAAAENAQEAADREILAFFTASPPATATGNGDIWINTETALDSSGNMNTLAIFVANTNDAHGFDARTSPTPRLYWNQSPNNALGVTYLEGFASTYAVNSIAYTAMATGNGKVVAFFGPHWPLDTGTHGPLVNTTPSGLENPDAHGDFWINTSNNNLMFIYNQNNSSITTEPDKAYAQTIYWNSPSAFSFDKSSDRSGWYSTEDDRTANALSTSYEAVADASRAQAAADREIIAFFQDGEPSGVGEANGDIWIDTDKYVTLNTSAIYVYHEQDTSWEISETSAIGQVYLNAYLAGETASRSESFLQNILGTQDLPFPIWDEVNDADNTANGIIGVGATGNVVFHKNRKADSVSADPGEIFIENLGGIDFVGPTGKLWGTISGDYGLPTTASHIMTLYENNLTTVDRNIDGTNGHGGAANVAYLMYSNQNVISRFSSTYTDNKWGNNHHFVPVYWDSVATTWSVRNDRSAEAATAFIPDAANGDFLVAQIERKYVETEAVGIHKLEPWIFETLPTQIKGLGDGKIVTYYENHYPILTGDKGKYGPFPNTTPTGLSNPNPHGDFWIDTANNNLVFRYHQNTTNRTAQTAYHAPIQPSNSNDESGWYSTEDLRVNTAFMQANSAYLLANSALQAAADSQAAADREILSFFADEADNPTTTTGNGDIWIVTDQAAKPGTRVANTRSIRVANTYAPAGAVTAGSNRFWHESPNNAIGLSYLKNYIQGIDNRAIADGKIVTHYGKHYYDAPYYYGPEPDFQPKLDSGVTPPRRIPNLTPHGDRWVNTSNNSLEFVYNQNNSNHTAQTIFYHPSAGFEFNLETDLSGWYSTEDDRVANALASSFNANAAAATAQGKADDAYENAATAQDAADREIIAVFQPSSAIGTSDVEATGFGDIWIQTDNPVNVDGTPNTAAIFRSNGAGTTYSNWVSNSTFGGENSAIGMMYLESFASGVSGAGSGSNIIPRGYSLFDAPSSDYVLSNTRADLGDKVPYPMYLSHPPNVEPRYSSAVINTTAGYIGTTSLQLTANQDSQIYFSNASPTTRAAFNNNRFAIEIPRGKKWVFSYFAKTNSSARALGGLEARARSVVYARDKDAPGANVSIISSRYQYFSANNVWQRFSVSFDLTGANSTHTDLDISEYNARTGTLQTQPSTLRAAEPGDISDSDTTVSVATKSYAANLNSLILQLETIENGAAEPDSGQSIWYDGLQLEEVPSNINLPSVFKEPSDSSTIVFGRQITDGKIVTRYEQQYGDYGPLPNTTPLGYPNPEPHGDSWHNISNNNIIFRYHQNSTNHTAQTIFYPVYGEASIALEDPSGWYSTEDPRAQTAMEGFVSALSAAATSRAAADREILAYFEPSTNGTVTSSGNGDIWIQTDNILNTDGTPNTYSIFVAFKSGATTVGAGNWVQSPYNAIGQGFLKTLTESAGSNWIPRGYSTFDVASSEYIIGDFTNDNDTIPYPLRPHNDAASGGTGYAPGAASAVINTTAGYIGTSSLQFSANNDGWVDFANGGIFERREAYSHRYAIDIPRGKKWIFSYYTKTNNSITTSDRAFVFLRDKDSPSANVSRITGEGGIFSTNNTWERRWFSFDLSNTTHDVSDYQVVTGIENGTGISSTSAGHVQDHDGSTIVATTPYAANVNSIILRVDALENGSTEPDEGVTVWYDGIQLEESIGGRLTPGPFQEASGAKSSDFAKAIADGKIVVHYEPNSGATEYLGPDPSLTPKDRLENLTPFGDLWVDVANNNLMFRYHQNSTNYTSRSVYHANNVQHKIDTDESGWYSTEDLRTANLEATTNILTANVNQALQDAAFALIASDAEILVFFEPSTNSTMSLDPSSYGSSVGPATGNGDIWIHTDQVYDADGNANTGAIFMANLYPGVGWTQSPENAIGRGFLEQLTSIGVKNWFPSGYSMWDASTSEYNIGINNEQNKDTPYPLTVPSDFPNDAANTVVNTSFGYVSPGSLQLTGGDGGSGGGEHPIVQFANLYAEASDKDIISRQSPGTTMKFVRGKRWIFSYYVYSNSSIASTANPRPQVFLHFNDDDDPNSNVVLFSKSDYTIPRNQWTRLSHVVDFSNTHVHANASGYTDKWNSWDSDSPESKRTYSTGSDDLNPWHEGRLANLNSMSLRLDFNTGDEPQSTMWFDGFQWEEAPGARQLAGPFSDPDRQISTHFARSIADGKIVTHYEPGSGTSPRYGPRPHVTPSELTNQSPHGDFWVDTANNNAMYRYNQNTSYQLFSNTKNDPVAQTAYWSTIGAENNKSGWYSIQDGKIGEHSGRIDQAYSDIADQLTKITTLEATSDGELQIFFETEGGHFANAVNTYSGASYGDLWINTTRYAGEGNHFANGTLSTNAIFRWQNSVSGFAEYITDLESGTNAPKGLAWRHAPNNAIGQVYLSTYAAQNLADTKITAYFTGNTDGGNQYLGEDAPASATRYLYGPQTNVTPSNTYNPNPDGDIWINTANNNEMYVYNRDATAVFSSVSGPSDDTTGYAQRVYWSSTTTNEGWYSAEDLRVGSHQLAKEIAEATGTDRHVQILFDTVAPTTTTGNGDIWISTETIQNADGSANLNAIHIANSLNTGIPAMPSDVVRYWHSEPSSALGRSHLEKLVTEIGKNWMPSEISAFNSPVTDYEFSSGSTNEEVKRPISRKNRMHTTIRRYDNDAQYADASLLTSTSNVQIEIVSDPPGARKEPQKTANSYFGNALRIKTGNTVVGGEESNTAWVHVTLTSQVGSMETPESWEDPRVIDIPRGKKWIISAWFKSYFGRNNQDASGNPWTMPSFRTYLKKKYDDDGTVNNWVSHVGATGGEGFHVWSHNPDYVDGEWVRRHMYLDLSTSDAVGGTQGTADDNYTYWSNNFTTDYTGNTEFNHANSVVTNYNDAFANISVHPTPTYHFHPVYGDNQISNTGLIFWDGSADDYYFADRSHQSGSITESAYMMNIQIRPHDGYSTSNPVYDTSFGVSSTDGVAGAGNTARVEIITDYPGANSYISGKALRIFSGNVINQGVANVTQGSGFIVVDFANNDIWKEDAGRSPLVIKNLPLGKRWILSAFTKSWQSDDPQKSPTFKTPQFYVYARTQDSDFSNNWYGSMPSTNSLPMYQDSSDWPGSLPAPEDGKWIRQYGVVDLTGSGYLTNETSGTGDEVYTYWSNTFDSSPEIFTGTDGYITHNNASVFRMSPANLYVASVPPVAERNIANSAMVLWDGDPDEYEFTGQGFEDRYPTGGRTLSTNTYEMFTTVRISDGSNWPADFNNMSTQLNSKTAGAGNTARAEIITDVVGGNSYISGKALHIKYGNVIKDGSSYGTSWIEVHTSNTHVEDAEVPDEQRNASLYHPFATRLTTGKKWVVSWWEKSFAERTRAAISLRKTGNTWASSIGALNWVGYSDPEEYFDGGYEGTNHHGSATLGSWHRRHQYIDLSSSNTILGFGGDWTSVADYNGFGRSNWNTDSAVGDELGWVTTGANVSFDRSYSNTRRIIFTKTTENYVPRHFSIFENADADYDLKAGISEPNPGSKFPIAVANGISGTTQDPNGIDSVGVTLAFDTANRANALGVLDPADSSGAGKSLKLTLPAVTSITYDQEYQFLFANVASRRSAPDGSSDFGASADHNTAYGLETEHFDEYGYGITIPAGKRWVYSCYIKHDRHYDQQGNDDNDVELNFSWYLTDGTTIYPDRSDVFVLEDFASGQDSDALGTGGLGTAGNWVRCHQVIDLTTGSNSNTSIILGMQADRREADKNIWFDGFQLEEVAAGVSTPSDFHPGTIMNAPRVANTILHSNTYIGTSGSFSGNTVDAARAWIIANTFTGTAQTWPLVATGAWSAGYSGLPTFSTGAGSANGPIIKWATVEDPVLGGVDGKQVAKATQRYYLEPNNYADNSGTSESIPYWLLKRIPTWRERNITQVAFQFFDDLAPGDQYDIRELRFWQSESLPRDEVDTIQMFFRSLNTAGETYIDGIMIEEVQSGATTPSPLPTAQTANIVHETTFLKDRSIGGIEADLAGATRLSLYDGSDGIGYRGNSYPRIAMTIANSIVSDTAYWSGILRYTSDDHNTWTVGDTTYDSTGSRTWQAFYADEPTWDGNGIGTVIWDMRTRATAMPRDIWEFQFEPWSNTSPFDSYQIIDVSIDDGGNDGGLPQYPYRHLPKKNEVNMLQLAVRNQTKETYIDGIMLEEVASDVTEPSSVPLTSNAIHETTFLYDHDPEAAGTGLHVGQSHQDGFDGYLYPRVVANVYNTHVTSTSSHWMGRLWWTTTDSDVFGTSAGQYLDVPAPTFQGAEKSNTIVWDLRSTSAWTSKTIKEVQFQLWSNTEIGDSYSIDHIAIDSGGFGTGLDTHEPRRNEVDALGFSVVAWGNEVEHFVDGIQVEEVTASVRRTPGLNQTPQEAGVIDFGRSIADGKTIYFTSNAFHGDTEDHKYGPSPQFTPEGLLNPTPYGDKWISLSPPYKTYLYFSNATNQTSQSAFHVPGTLTPAGIAFANTHWPYGTTNNASGWYEYRDTGDALTQFGLDVKLHKDSIDKVALGGGTYVDEGTTILETPVTPPEDSDGSAPTFNFGPASEFGQTREIALNPVPPSDANLQGHWTLNSSGVDESGNVFVYDVSGRNNHALFRNWNGIHPNQSAFKEHDPAEDFVNVSGNRSLYLEAIDSDGLEWQSLILAANSTDSQSSYQGAAYPVDSTNFTKQTLTFWYKPTIGNQGSAALVGQHGASGIDGAWKLHLNGQMTNNNDIRLLWQLNGDYAVLEHDGNPSGGVSYLDGWYGANDAGTYTPIRNNEWHFIAIQTDQDTNNQALWIYREGEGLLYYKANTSETISNPQRPLFLNGDSTGRSIFDGSSPARNANGYYDEVRLYNTMLTPRNIRYLYMNPSGRPRQLQPRPGLAVKKNHITFANGYPSMTSVTDPGAAAMAINAFAYFHGFDVDGNPADVNPYISVDGQVKYLNRGYMKMRLNPTTGKYMGNTGYVMYNMETAWTDLWNSPSVIQTGPDAYYVFAMPIGANSTQPHTWQYHNYNGHFIKFTPDESKHIVVGEARLANSVEQDADTIINPHIQSVEAYQMARQPSVVRESYNFTLSPQDLIDNFAGGDHFFANDTFWESSEGIDATYIANLVADKIAAGTIGVGVKVGAEAKVLLDGKNSRIVIKD